MRVLAFGIAVLATFPLASCATVQPKMANSDAMVLSQNRPQKDIDRDADRKPIETLKFSGIGKGQHIVEYTPGSGYFSRLISNAIGKDGSLSVGTPQLFIDKFGKGIIPSIGNETGHENVKGFAIDDQTTILPQNIDVFFTAQNYHDIRIYLSPGTTERMNKAVFDALKPGGVYLIIDHSAKAGSGEQAVKDLHRIDPAIVIKEVEAAGFKLQSQSKILQNPADDLSLNVFDPKIRGKTDQFIMKFVKPK